MSPFFETTPAAPKICGITKETDAIVSIQAGAGALGFNFYPPSPRSIPWEADLGWIKDLEKSFPDVARVAVVVNPNAVLLATLRRSGYFNAIQFHGDESPEFCAREGKSFPYWIKALRVRSEEDLAAAKKFDTHYLLLDATVPGSYGGSGHQLDWGLAAGFVASNRERRVILAGGLTAENVAVAVEQVHPHAVDVASGVELSPGVKAPQKIREFIAVATAVY